MSRRILLLGGVAEALRIARQLGPEHIYSLAGIGRVPDDLSCQIRVGGYGGAEGLADFLRAEGIDLPLLAEWAAGLGADAELQDAMRGANTSQQALALAHAAGVPLGDTVCAHALAFARRTVPAGVSLEVFAIDRQGGIVGRAGVR